MSSASSSHTRNYSGAPFKCFRIETVLRHLCSVWVGLYGLPTLCYGRFNPHMCVVCVSVSVAHYMCCKRKETEMCIDSAFPFTKLVYSVLRIIVLESHYQGQGTNKKKSQYVYQFKSQMFAYFRITQIRLHLIELDIQYSNNFTMEMCLHLNCRKAHIISAPNAYIIDVDRR